MSALSNQLIWQLSDLSSRISIIEEQLLSLERQYQSSQQHIISASDIPTTILPEQEMARLQFILKQQQEQDKLNTSKIDLNAELTMLQKKQMRLKTDLKRIELYQSKQHQQLRQQALTEQYKQADEWSLLHREHA